MPLYLSGREKIKQVFLRQMLHALPQFVFIKDRHSIYVDCNQNYAELVGLSSPAEIAGKSDKELNWQPGGHTADIFIKGDQDTLSGHPINNQEEILILPSGKKLTALVSKLPIVDDHDEILGIIGYFSDITVLKEKECELQQARQQAESANQAKSAFITNISHDIRTPLSAVISIANLFTHSAPETWSQDDAIDLLKSAQSLLNLLNEIIDYSKWESGDLPVYDVRFNLRETLNNVIDLYGVSAKEKQLELDYCVTSDIPDYFIGDHLRLQRILSNLLDNAIKFTAQGGVKLSVETLKRQQKKLIIKISVIDTGIGIPKEKQAMIFTRFNRLNPSYQGLYSGIGLGLPLVKQMVTELGGEIYVESVENKGSTFTCLLPLQLSLLSNSEQLKKSSIQVRSHCNQSSSGQAISQQILLVEDNLLIQRVLKNQLEQLKVIVHTSDNGTQALEKIENNDYTLIIMDIGLPDQDGCEVAIAIHRYQTDHGRPLTPIIALSAHIDENRQQRCLAAGMISAWNKPLDQPKLEEIAALLRSGCEFTKESSSKAQNQTYFLPKRRTS